MNKQIKKPINIILLIVLFVELAFFSQRVYADLTGTEGLAIDLSSAGAGTDFTIAFDPTEFLGSRTWGDGSTDTIVWTWNRETGTDPTITFNSGSIGLPALTITTPLAVTEGGTGTTSLSLMLDAVFGSNGLLKRSGAETYTVITDSSTNWDAAYNWGDHAGLYEATDPNLTGIAAVNWTNGQFVRSGGSGNFAGVTANAGTDITADLEEETHASEHAVSGADTVFPADPDADRYLMWDEDPGALVWADIAGGGDMLKSTYDVSGDGFVDGNDVAYSAAWNGDVNAPSMNAVYDKIETFVGGGDMLKSVYDVSNDGFVDGNDVVYSVAWNGDINAPSMNAVYDKIVALTLSDLTDIATTGTDPDVDASGELGIDTDGANEPNDVTLRTSSISGNQQYALAGTHKVFIFPICDPDNLAEATFMPIFPNRWGMTFHITKITGQTNVDDFTFTLKEWDEDGQNVTTIEAVTLSTDGTGMYYGSVAEGDIDHKVIEAGHCIGYVKSADDATYVTLTIEGWFDADVD